MKEKIKVLFKEYYNDETMPVVELEDKVLDLFDVVGQSEQCNHKFERVEKGGEFQGNQCDCGEWEDLT